MSKLFDTLKWPGAEVQLPLALDWESDPYFNSAFVVEQDRGGLRCILSINAEVEFPKAIAQSGADNDTLVRMVVERFLIDIKELMPAMSKKLERAR